MENYSLKGDNDDPNFNGIKNSNINSPEINNNLKNINNIQSIKINELDKDINSNSNIKSPKSTFSPKDSNLKSKDNNSYSLYGSIQGINSPKNETFNYELIGKIPGKNMSKEKYINNSNNKKNKYSIFLEGIIPSKNNEKNTKNEIKNDIKINKEETKINISQGYNGNDINKNKNNDNNNNDINQFENQNIIINSNLNIKDSNIIDNKNISNDEKDNKQSFNLTLSQLKIDEEINKNNINNNNINNNQISINFETPKNEIKQEIKEQEVNNLKNVNNNKFNNNNLGNIIMSDEKSSKIFSQRGNSRKKKGLPLVGPKNYKFEMSKLGSVGQFDLNSINFNNLKSTNVGVNGVKIGDRILK